MFNILWLSGMLSQHTGLVGSERPARAHSIKSVWVLRIHRWHFLEQLRSPAGLNIGAENAPEIASVHIGGNFKRHPEINSRWRWKINQAAFMANIPHLLLAAGSSSRMGQPKQLLRWKLEDAYWTSNWYPFANRSAVLPLFLGLFGSYFTRHRKIARYYFLSSNEWVNSMEIHRI